MKVGTQPGPHLHYVGTGLSVVGSCDRDGRLKLSELVAVFVCVMLAEQEFAACRKRCEYPGTGPAPVAAIKRSEPDGGRCCGHYLLHSGARGLRVAD